MKKVFIAATLTTVSSTMANGHSGLAGRINEERSYPNKDCLVPVLEDIPHPTVMLIEALRILPI